MSEKSNKDLPYGDDPSLRKITIDGIAHGIRQLEYLDKGLPEPDPAELQRMAEERYESSKKNGPDNHIGTGKQNQ